MLFVETNEGVDGSRMSTEAMEMFLVLDKTNDARAHASEEIKSEYLKNNSMLMK